MARRRAIALSVLTVVLMFAWNFVPEDVAYRGGTLRCWPAAVNRSSPPSEVSDQMLACRPTASRRELQGYAGVAVALTLIWGTYNTKRRSDDRSEH